MKPNGVYTSPPIVGRRAEVGLQRRKPRDHPWGDLSLKEAFEYEYKNESGLSTGALVGIVIGAVAAAILVAAGVWYCYRNHNGKSASPPASISGSIAGRDFPQ